MWHDKRWRSNTASVHHATVSATAIAFPALYQVPSDFPPDLLRIVQRCTDILPTFSSPTLHVLSDFLLDFFRLIHR